MRTDLENVLSAMITDGWANRSNGNVDAPTGHFAHIGFTREELLGFPGGAKDAFSDVSVSDSFDWESLIGEFIVVEDSNGFMHITKYPFAGAATHEYYKLLAEFTEWDNN